MAESSERASASRAANEITVLALGRDVRVDGRDGDLSMEGWALCAEGPQNYFVVEVVYFPQTGQPIRVWEDLQAYVDSFRVIR